MNRGKTEAETLRLNGWGPGDILEGDEGYGPEQIKIIVVGGEKFICRWKHLGADAFGPETGTTTLTCREWRKVAHDPAHDDAPESDVDWQSVANSAIDDISAVLKLLKVSDEDYPRPITEVVGEHIARFKQTDDSEMLPSDLRTHMGDFREAICQAMASGDPEGYWQHQLDTLDRLEMRMSDASDDAPHSRDLVGVSCGYPELDAGSNRSWL